MTGGVHLPARALDVSELLDARPWGGYQRWLVALTALAIVFDGIDNQLMGVAIPTIMREWGVPRTAFAPVVSLGFVGMMVGGAIAGLVGDRVGRRVALIASMLVFGVMTLLAALAGSVTALGMLRLLAGLGLGGAIPNAATLAAEYVPIRQRPIAVTVTIVCVPLGATLAGLIAIPVLPALGWRALFVAGGITPIAGALALTLLLPESPRYLARRASRRPELVAFLRRAGCQVPDDAGFLDRSGGPMTHASVASLFVPEFRKDTVALWAAFFSCLLSVYLGFSWVPSMLSGAGFSASVASTGITAFNLGGVAGALAGGLCITRWGSRRSILVMAVLGVISAAALGAMNISTATPVRTIVVMLTLSGAMINGVTTTMYALAAHVYPAAVRATGAGSAISFGRIGAIVSGYLGAWALDLGTATFFGLIAVAMSFCVIAVATVTRHVPGRS